jgi:uncharacterized protein YprB with RNaseH-like and TPR domain
VGYATERRIWESGVDTWDGFLVEAEDLRLGPRTREILVQGVSQSIDRLRDRDHPFFAMGLPPREHWRAFSEFRDRTAFLDIETTGLRAGEHQITMVGVYDGRRYRAYVAGIDLDDLPQDLARYAMIVTYNGARFDLPFLREAFPQLRMDQIHVDLRYPLRRLGFSGGLKRIERRLGIERSEATRYLDGWDAVRLWRRYQRGDRRGLDLLRAYNREDVVHLELLMDLSYCALKTLCLRVCNGAPADPHEGRLS